MPKLPQNHGNQCPTLGSGDRSSLLEPHRSNNIIVDAGFRSLPIGVCHISKMFMKNGLSSEQTN